MYLSLDVLIYWITTRKVVFCDPCCNLKSAVGKQAAESNLLQLMELFTSFQWTGEVLTTTDYCTDNHDSGIYLLVIFELLFNELPMMKVN